MLQRSPQEHDTVQAAPGGWGGPALMSAGDIKNKLPIWGCTGVHVQTMNTWHKTVRRWHGEGHPGKAGALNTQGWINKMHAWQRAAQLSSTAEQMLEERNSSKADPLIQAGCYQLRTMQVTVGF